MDFIVCSTTTIDHKKFLLRRILIYIRKKILSKFMSKYTKNSTYMIFFFKN